MMTIFCRFWKRDQSPEKFKSTIIQTPLFVTAALDYPGLDVCVCVRSLCLIA